MPRDTKPCPRCLVTRAPGRGGAGPLERDPEAEDPLPVEEEEEADLAPQAPPPPLSRTKWTRRVPHPVLIGHAAY
jgi:hypothetical protein